MVVCDKCRSPVQNQESLKAYLRVWHSSSVIRCIASTECVLCDPCCRLLCKNILDAYEAFFEGAENVDVKITEETDGKVKWYFAGRLEVLQEFQDAIDFGMPEVEPPPESG